MASEEDLAHYQSKIDEYSKGLLEAANSEDGWNFIKENKGIKIYKKPMHNSPIHAIKGKGEIKASPEEVLSMVKALDHIEHWDPLYRKGHVVQSFDEYHDVIHALYSLDTPLVSDREFVYLETRKPLEKGGYSVLSFSIDRPDIPLYPKAVRGQIVSTGFVLEPSESNGTIVNYIIQVDPRGWLPPFIVNLVSGDEPMCVKNIEDYMEKRRQKRESNLASAEKVSPQTDSKQETAKDSEKTETSEENQKKEKKEKKKDKKKEKKMEKTEAKEEKKEEAVVQKTKEELVDTTTQKALDDKKAVEVKPAKPAGEGTPQENDEGVKEQQEEKRKSGETGQKEATEKSEETGTSEGTQDSEENAEEEEKDVEESATQDNAQKQQSKSKNQRKKNRRKKN